MPAKGEASTDRRPRSESPQIAVSPNGIVGVTRYEWAEDGRATNLRFAVATGSRLGDLRRLILQYGRTSESVFPTGSRPASHSAPASRPPLIQR